MAKIAGITVERTRTGRARYVRIDMNKFGDELYEFFKSKGIIIDDGINDPKIVQKIKKQEGVPGVKIKIDDLWK